MHAAQLLPVWFFEPTMFLCLWDFLGKNTRVGLLFLPPGGLPNLGIKPPTPESPSLAGVFFTTKPLEKPKRK